jgi:hypothetical protein
VIVLQCVHQSIYHKRTSVMGDHPSWVSYAHYLATVAAAVEITNWSCTPSPPWLTWTQGIIRYYCWSWTKVISPHCQHTLSMHSLKLWLMLLNKVSLFLPKSSTIQKRPGQTMAARHTTKTTMHTTALLPFPPPHLRPKLERRSSQKCLCFFVRPSSESQLSPGIGWD